MKEYLISICQSVKNVMEEEIKESEKAGYSLEIGRFHAFKYGKTRLFKLIMASKQLYPNLIDLFEFIENMICCIKTYNDLDFFISNYEE